MKRWLIWVVLLLSFLLRVVSIKSMPIGFTPDEASFGYDAYSILKTAKDQWGVKLPIVLKSFGDYKSPLLSYLQIPFIFILGLNETAVRLPAAIIGSLAILATYLLIDELFKDKFKIESWKFGIGGAMLIAVSSWHIMLSRGAFEANLPTFFVSMGVYLFLKGLKESRYLNLSALVFGLNLFTYHSAKFVTPILLILLTLFYWSKIKQIDLKKLIVSTSIFLLFFSLMIYSLRLGGGVRINERSIFQGALEEGAKTKIALIQNGMNPILARVLHNKYQVTISRFIKNYVQYYSFRFLFLKGPMETTYGMIPGIGVLYWFELPFLLGILLSFVNKTWKKEILFLLVWVLVSTVPAAMATGVGYSANRAAIMMPALNILLIFGAYNLYLFIKNKNIKITKYFLIGYLSISLLIVANFLKTYFFEGEMIMAKGMLYGNLEIGQWLKENSNNSSNIIVSRRLSEPHIYLAFAQKINPAIFQENSEEWDLNKFNVSWVDQIPEYNLAKYKFRNIEWKEDVKLENTLFIGRPEEFPSNIEKIKTFFYPDGTEALLVVNNK